MSAAMEVLAELRIRGARAWIEGDRLLVSPSRALDPGLRERIRARKPELVSLLRAAPPEMQQLSARGREALGGKAPTSAQPAQQYASPSGAAERRDLLDRFLRDERIPFATFDSRTAGAFLIVRDRRALQSLDQEHAVLPVLYLAELEHWAGELGASGLRALLAARGVEGPGVELRRVYGSRRDG